MNTYLPDSQVRERPFWRRPLFWALVVVFAIYGVATLGVVQAISFFRVSSDSRALRECIIGADAPSWHKKAEVSPGVVSLGLARLGLSFVEGIPQEARTALQALRGAEVGVYERSVGGDMGPRSSMLAAADRAMAARGWERVVGVVERRDVVLVYVPRDLRAGRQARVCVAVINERNLVVAMARANLAPLLRLAQEAFSRAERLRAVRYGEPPPHRAIVETSFRKEAVVPRTLDFVIL